MSFKFGSFGAGGGGSAKAGGGLYAGISLDNHPDQGEGAGSVGAAAEEAETKTKEGVAEAKAASKDDEGKGPGWSASLRFAPVIRKPPAKKAAPSFAAFSAPVPAAPKPLAFATADEDEDDPATVPQATKPFHMPGKAKAALTSSKPAPGSAPFAPPPSNVFARNGGFLAAHAPERHPANISVIGPAAPPIETPSASGKGWAPAVSPGSATPTVAKKESVDPGIPGLQTSLPALLAKTTTLSALSVGGPGTNPDRPMRRKLAQPPPLTLPESDNRSRTWGSGRGDVNGFSQTEEGKKAALKAARGNKKKKGKAKGKEKEFDPAVFFAEEYDPLRPNDYNDWIQFLKSRRQQARFLARAERAEMEARRREEENEGYCRSSRRSRSYSRKSRSCSRSSYTSGSSRSRSRSWSRSRSRSRVCGRGEASGNHSRSSSCTRNRSRSRSCDSHSRTTVRGKALSPSRTTRQLSSAHDDGNSFRHSAYSGFDASASSVHETTGEAYTRPAAMSAPRKEETADEAYARRAALSQQAGDEVYFRRAAFSAGGHSNIPKPPPTFVSSTSGPLPGFVGAHIQEGDSKPPTFVTPALGYVPTPQPSFVPPMPAPNALPLGPASNDGDEMEICSGSEDGVPYIENPPTPPAPAPTPAAAPTPALSQAVVSSISVDEARARARAIAEKFGRLKAEATSSVPPQSVGETGVHTPPSRPPTGDGSTAPPPPLGFASPSDAEAGNIPPPASSSLLPPPTDSVAPLSGNAVALLAEAQAKARALAAKFGQEGQAQAQAAAELAASKAPGQANFARRLMDKYGWKEGQGLGAAEDGRTTILTVEAVPPQQSQKRKKHQPFGEDDGDEGMGPAAKRPAAGSMKGKGVVVDQSKAERERAEKEKFGEPTRVVCLSNVVGLDELDDDLGDEMAQEARKHGIVERCFVRILQRPCEEWESVRVFIVFSGLVGAWKAVKAFEGRWFGGREVRARFFPENALHLGDFDR